ncbi:MAG: hypothetical protein N0C84_00670 [Candidatus Thiodiazotropha taylori]|uniref:Uncharacterized protein n=1 Tax=Candidatus Thiodiazotropha taylori TaxID=2792791 RepID=A0A9E4KAQ2_9GAMM|nr:hypothetical protein [Candidatus Thiodiazotropha taylori]MCW4254958.1 hypothetical protein [Candidatus Thiodiazotropha taylori]
MQDKFNYVQSSNIDLEDDMYELIVNPEYSIQHALFENLFIAQRHVDDLYGFTCEDLGEFDTLVEAMEFILKEVA